MKKASLSFILCFSILFSMAQSSVVEEINRLNSPNAALAPLRFLASDELMGRGNTRPEIHIAARYLSEQFRSFGLQEMAGTENYVQNFELRIISAPANGYLVVGNKTYYIGKDLLQARGIGLQLTAPVVFAGFGTAADVADIDVKGKIVVVNMGENDSTKLSAAGRFRDAKQKLLQGKGAIAIIERYWQSASDWERPKHAFSSQRVVVSQDSMIPVFMIHDPEAGLLPAVKSSATASINVTGNNFINVPAKNVMGWVEGTDPQLKNEFIVLSAHYDHMGVAAVPKMEEGKLDSIYNGARDNAIGVTAVINAAHYFAQHPAKRSILFIAFTGEEMGLLGSKHFAAHPPIGLEKVVFNLNIDNGGYNDTSLINVIGLGRTSADDDISKACTAYGLTLKGDPAPEMNLFDRSDNVSFAAKGVPAPTFGMGIKKVDETIRKYYHQLGDEIGNIDLGYTLKYMKTFILAAKYIADNPAQPQWKKGDKYEAAWKVLYSKP
ncbi:MAG: M28 family peptidase [Bacteroidota bacterium]